MRLHHICKWCLFFGLVLSIIGCGKEAPPSAEPPTITYLAISPAPLTLTKKLSGRTSPYVISEVRPQISGIVRERLFVEGSDVKVGDVLYKIDSALYRSEYDRAQAELQNAQAVLTTARLLAERTSKLVDTKAVSQQEYDNAVAAHKQAQARVQATKAQMETAKINLEYTSVTAPVSGRIGPSTVTLGALVTQNQLSPMTTIQQLDPIYVDLTESTAELLKLRKALSSGQMQLNKTTGMNVLLFLDNNRPYTQQQPVKDSMGNIQYTEGPIIGRLEFADITVKESTGSVRLRVLFPNPEGVLLPGMFVRAVIEQGEMTDAILIPQRAVSRNNRGEAVVWILTPQVSESKSSSKSEPIYDVTQRVVKTDRAVDNQWLISEGILPGEKIVVDGFVKIKPGQPVKAQPLQRKALTPINGQ